MRCLDIDCGSGDVAFELARRVGPAGLVVGVDFDQVKLARAQKEVQSARMVGMEFRRADVTELSGALYSEGGGD